MFIISNIYFKKIFKILVQLYLIFIINLPVKHSPLYSPTVTDTIKSFMAIPFLCNYLFLITFKYINTKILPASSKARLIALNIALLLPVIKSKILFQI
jgi:hypothetical protein